MKKKLLFLSLSVLAIAAVVTVKSINTKSGMSSLMTQNIEALTQNEGGTSVSTCYIEKSGSPTGWYPMCDRNTSTSSIYPCPSSQSYIATAASSMCTR